MRGSYSRGADRPPGARPVASPDRARDAGPAASTGRARDAGPAASTGRARDAGPVARTGRAPEARQTLPAVIGNAAIGRLLRSSDGPVQLRRALGAHLEPGLLAAASRRPILARDVEPGEGMEVIKGNAPAAPKALGPKDRPSSAQFWDSYRSVSYAIYHGEEMRDDVWKYVGGSIGDDFTGGNTCATRVSWAFNNLGWPVRTLTTPSNMFKVKFFFNKPGVEYKGKSGDGKWYIVGAPDMESYLTLLWGKPDSRLKTNEKAKTFEGTLAPGQIAIFAGAHHSGAIMGQDSAAGFNYHDAYVESDPGVMPVSAWILPP
jgi:Type VI secretion system (T6SS), amidase effector protein 4